MRLRNIGKIEVTDGNNTKFYEYELPGAYTRGPVDALNKTAVPGT